MMRKSLFAMLVLALLLAVVPALAQDADATDVPVLIAFSGERLDWTRERAAEFNELYPEYNVTVEGLPSYNDVFDQTILAFEQGNPPAVIQYFEAATQEARDAVNADGEPLLANVGALLEGMDEINGVPVILNDVVGSAAAYYTLDGDFTSVPWNTSSTVMFSNMNILNEAGVEEIPETWQELEAACETIMAMEDAPEGCMTWPNHSWWVEQTMGQLGELLANNNNGRDERATEVFLNSDGMNNYISWWAGQEANGNYLYTGTQRDWGGTYQAFISGQVAFLQYSSSDATNLTRDGEEAGIEVVTTRLPYDAETEYVGNIIGGATLWLVNGLAEDVQTGGLMFMNFLSNPENAADWHRVTGYIPITEGAIEILEEEGFWEENPNSAIASRQLAIAAENDANPGALVGNFVAIRDVITAAIEDIFVNDLDVAERLAEANEEANQLLEEYNLLYTE
jgi:sn-glycerol 3-phosphate transport system substrate-binding protein